jgi:hypothetical protein
MIMMPKPRMSEDDIRLMDQQTRHQIAETHRLVAPDLRALMRTQMTAEGIAAHRGRLAAGERDLFDLKVALAHADLTTLRDSLRQYRDLIAAEIRQHHVARSAATAYVKSLQNAKPRRVS